MSNFFKGEYKIMNHTYKMKFRCTNCGLIFEREVQKGLPALGKGGECPHCGLVDGKPGVGHFTVIQQTTETFEPYNTKG